ncbi:hypothetical protein PoB_000614300 [Plakobranchus ocellatus]|uniref:IMS import disulfide relay-system CHCH-CHCH-like Cx9C domain-containing protein n=1 Tax=Plakobranchus ocellatus TaxID=259542 RepID=A0AAV3YAV8_9GAST|nr:hypothetical protein PoB_000614300 [Plakobranchus ocellatus]
MKLVEQHCSKYLAMFGECVHQFPHTWQMDCEPERRKLARCAETKQVCPEKGPTPLGRQMPPFFPCYRLLVSSEGMAHVMSLAALSVFSELPHRASWRGCRTSRTSLSQSTPHSPVMATRTSPALHGADSEATGKPEGSSRDAPPASSTS